MSHMVVKECERGNEQVLKDAQRIAGEEGYRPSDPKEVCADLKSICAVTELTHFAMCFYSSLQESFILATWGPPIVAKRQN